MNTINVIFHICDFTVHNIEMFEQYDNCFKVDRKKVWYHLHLQTSTILDKYACGFCSLAYTLFSSQRLEELVAYLRDQVQDIRVRSNRQGKFVNSCAEQLVCQGLKVNSQKEKELEDEVGVCVYSCIILCPRNCIEVEHYSNTLVSTQNIYPTLHAVTQMKIL